MEKLINLLNIYAKQKVLFVSKCYPGHSLRAQYDIFMIFATRVENKNGRYKQDVT